MFKKQGNVAMLPRVKEIHLSQRRDIETNIATFQSVEISNVATLQRVVFFFFFFFFQFSSTS